MVDSVILDALKQGNDARADSKLLLAVLEYEELTRLIKLTEDEELLNELTIKLNSFDENVKSLFELRNPVVEQPIVPPENGTTLI